MNDTEIIHTIDAKMGKGWTRKLANVLATDLTLNAEVIFSFEKFDSEGNHKYLSKRKIGKSTP